MCGSDENHRFSGIRVYTLTSGLSKPVQVFVACKFVRKQFSWFPKQPIGRKNKLL